MRLEQLVFPHSPARGRSQQARAESGRTAAIDPALRGLVRRTGSSGNGWRYWGYHARRGKTHGRRCRQLKGPELSEKMKLAPQVGFEPTTLRLTAECSTVELLRSKCVISLKQTRTRTVKSSHSTVPDAGAGSLLCSPACPSAPPPPPPRPPRSAPPPRRPSSSRTPSPQARSPAGSRSTRRSLSSPRRLPLRSSSPPRTIPQSPAPPKPPPSSRRSAPGTPPHADSESRTNRSPRNARPRSPRPPLPAPRRRPHAPSPCTSPNRSNAIAPPPRPPPSKSHRTQDIPRRCWSIRSSLSSSLPFLPQAPSYAEISTYSAVTVRTLPSMLACTFAPSLPSSTRPTTWPLFTFLPSCTAGFAAWPACCFNLIRTTAVTVRTLPSILACTLARRLASSTRPTSWPLFTFLPSCTAGFAAWPACCFNLIRTTAGFHVPCSYGVS